MHGILIVLECWLLGACACHGKCVVQEFLFLIGLTCGYCASELVNQMDLLVRGYIGAVVGICAALCQRASSRASGDEVSKAIIFVI